MKLLMLCREPRLYSCQRLQTAAAQRGYAMDILDPNRFQLRLENGVLTDYYQYGESNEKNRPDPEKLPDYAAVIGRFGTASTEMGCNVLRHFELQGVAVLNNAQSFRLARDKWQSLQTLVTSGIAVPNTAITGELFATSVSLNGFSHPIIIKTLSGSQGVGVMKLDQKSSSMSLLDTLKAAQIPTLQQQFISESQGQDIRAFVIGDQVVAAMVRQGASGEFRANIHQGGNATSIQLSAAEQQLAIQATKALGLDVAGVDLVRSKKGLLVLEVNASPGLEMIEKVSGVDIAGKMIDFCKKLIESDRL
ncbi:ribosomal protein S6 modification protein [Pasteurellaceae bacterium Orientalotternb1]|nr:ribosomal protein S6 modification protein [Pasteurellaceae bacterium Orientalotternb1]